MRFKLTLTRCGRNDFLPFNYQYPLSAWTYKTLARADKDYAHWLHEHGYGDGIRNFKLFTFSALNIPQFRIINNQLRILSTDIYLILSFHVEEAVEKFITGLFSQQKLSLGDKHNCVDFEIKAVERLPDPEFSDEMVFECLSPVCISRPMERNGKLIPQYLHPEDEDYQEYFFNHLVRKYVTSSRLLSEAGQQQDPSFELAGATLEEEALFEFELLSKPKSRLVKIKAGTPYETSVRGFLYRFRLKAPKELIEFGYEAGMGEKGSLGFGCAEQVEK